MSRLFLSSISACIACALLLSACSPKYDWREVHGDGIPFSVVLPAKPTTSARPVNLDGIEVTMTMTAAEVDGVMFAIGRAELPDAAQAIKALTAMKTALSKNIGGTIRREAATGGASVPATIDLEALGAPGKPNGGQPRLLIARFIAIDKRVYQLVVVGAEKAIPRESVDTFLTSFKPS